MLLPLSTVLDSEILEAQSTLASRTRSFTLRQLRQQCTILGLATGKCNKWVLLSMVGKLPNQPVVYEGFDHQDLLNSTMARGLELSEAAQGHLTKYMSKREVVKAKYQAKKAAPEHHPSLLGDTTMTTGPGILVRRSSRLAARALHTINKDKSLTGELARPVKTPAARRVIHKSSYKSRQSLQRSFEAVEQLSKKSLIQELESADRRMQFDFLGLPPELRDMVLHLVCVSTTTIVQAQHQPDIARTCRLLRHEALAVYYGFNRFGVFVGKPARGSYLDKNHWLQNLQSCYLASVRSFSFIYLSTNALLDIDFDIRGQKFSIVRWSRHHPSTADQTLRSYLAAPSSYFYPRTYLIHHIEAVRRGSTLLVEFPYVKASSSLLVAFNTAVNKRVGQATTLSSDDTTTAKTKDWKRLSDEWQTRKGFSVSSIQMIAKMLAENKVDVRNLWVGTFDDYWADDE